MKKHPISQIIYCPNVALVTLPEVDVDSAVRADILTTISDGGVNVDVISQTAPRGGSISMAFSVSMEAVGRLLPILGELKARHPGLRCEITPAMTKVNFFDANMVNTPGVAALVFRMLEKIPVHMIATSTVDISILVEEHNLEDLIALCRETLDITPEEVAFR